MKDLELHMGEAMHVFDALKDECLDSNVFDEYLGAMGAYRVENWSTKIGVLLEYTEANGGCTLKITTPPLNHAEQHLDMVKLLRNLVDVVWSEAKESDEVPSTKWADELIAKVYPFAAPKPEM